MQQLETNQGSDRQQILKDIGHIDFRVPVVDSYDPAVHDVRPDDECLDARARLLDHQKQQEVIHNRTDWEWLVLTEAAKRAIAASSAARQVAAGFSSRPLSEALPLQAMVGIAQEDPRTQRIADRVGSSLGYVLKLDEVPDALLRPDLKHSPSLKRRDVQVGRLARYKGISEDLYVGSIGKLEERIIKTRASLVLNELS